jgi:hypothetical protein
MTGIRVRNDSESEGERDEQGAGEPGVELRYCCLRTNCVELPSLHACSVVQDLR